jgi:hypothetical protein
MLQKRRPRQLEMRDFMQQIYNGDAASVRRSDLAQRRRSHRAWLASLSKGVPIATPVFDGATQRPQIQAPAARLAQDLPVSGQTHAVLTAAPATPSSVRSRSATCTC